LSGKGLKRTPSASANRLTLSLEDSDANHSHRRNRVPNQEARRLAEEVEPEQQRPGDQNNSGDEPDDEEGDGEEIPRASTVERTLVPVSLWVASGMSMDPRAEVDDQAGCDGESLARLRLKAWRQRRRLRRSL
jgi:hypothetical protein